MNLFKSKKENLFHYITSVTYRRLPIFRNKEICSLFIDVLKETRKDSPFKLIGYVLMPDHFHLLINPLGLDIRKSINLIKGRSAKRILDWLRENHHDRSLEKLAFSQPRKSGQTHAVWQKGFSSIDIWSEKFVIQKLGYIHANPVRAELCDHPAKWKWSSYHAYLPHSDNDVPIEIDWRPYWEF